MHVNDRFIHFLILSVLLFAGCDFAGDEEQLRVIAYAGPDFTSSDPDVSWAATIEGPKITLQTVPNAESIDSLTYVITLEDRPGELPKLVDAWYGPFGGGIGLPLNTVTVEIRDWDLQEQINGAVRAQLPTGPKTYAKFWVDLSSESKTR